MKPKFYIFTLLCFFTYFFVKAQNTGFTSQNEIKFEKERAILIGWSVGYNCSSIVNEDRYKGSFKPIGGLKLGICSAFQVNSLISIEGGLSFEQKGFHAASADYDMRVNYISTSVSSKLRYRFINAFFGIFYGYAVQRNPSFELNSYPAGAILPNEIKNNDFGVRMGIGTSFLNRFSIEFSYEPSLISFFDDPQFSPGGNPTGDYIWHKNRVFSISLRSFLFRKSAMNQVPLNSN